MSKTATILFALCTLFCGRLDNVHISGEYQVLALSLTKNTNILSCILQSQSAAPLDTDDFRLELTARNGCMDHRNTPTDSVSTCYLPFMQESANLEDIQVVHAGMNTLRLMENDDTRLRLIHQPDGKEIFDIPLTPYLLLSRNVETTYMPPQEYLDRQDRYNLSLPKYLERFLRILRMQDCLLPPAQQSHTERI